MVNLFDTPARAEGYAKARPPLHAGIVERIAVRAATALDVGCGAGLSTPRSSASPRTSTASTLSPKCSSGPAASPREPISPPPAPSPSRSAMATFDLITAAGSLNYADPTRAFPELRRVLTPDGTLAVYDFSICDFPYHRPPDGALELNPEILSQMDTGFGVIRSEPPTSPS